MQIGLRERRGWCWSGRPGSREIIDIRRWAAGTPSALAARTVQLGCDGEDLGMLSEVAQSRAWR